MHNETTSRHIRSSIELFIMVPIKPGFVQTSELVATYSSRVRTVLNALFELRQQKIERGFGEPIGPIELLETIHRVQWTVLEPFDEEVRTDLPPELWRQIRSPQLILTSHFDTSWEHYFSELVVTGQPLLDLIFSHCVDYEGHSCLDGYEVFSNYIRRHQRPINFMYAGSPDVSEHDIGFFKKVLAASAGQSSAGVQHGRIRDQAKRETGEIRQTAYSEATRSARRTIFGLKELRDRLFSDEIELISPKPRTGQDLFDTAIASVLVNEPDAYRLKVAAKANEPEEAARKERPLGWGIDLVTQAAIRQEQVRAKLEKPPTTDLPDGTKIDKGALLANVQGNILRSHPATSYGAAVLVSCDDARGFASLIATVRAKMADAAAQATAEAAARTQGPSTEPTQVVSVNFALTYNGLARMGLGKDVMQHFPREFREGLEDRAGLVGDVETNHPSGWQHPVDAQGRRVHLSRIDALLFVYAGDEQLRDGAVAALREAQDGFQLVEVIPSQVRKNSQGQSIDPFGFADPVSQPVPPKELDDAPDPRARDRVAVGEFVLGYPNRGGAIAASTLASANPRSHTLFRDSTYVVVRKTAMDRKAFEAYVGKVATQIGLPAAQASQAEAEAKLRIVGRRPDGTHPLAPDGSNEFNYEGDADGAKCPLHAHVRRANPRIPNAPRILRRGMTYGTWKDGKLSDEGEYGLLFIAYNASLAEQYEIIQRWINGGNITGQSSLQNDLHIGTPALDDIPRWAYDAQGKPFPMPKPEKETPFATLRWGLYGFVPSKAALGWLADTLARPYDRYPEDVAAVARGRVRLAELDELPPELAAVEWKRLLEEVAEVGSKQARQADDIWAAVRAEGGVRKVRPDLVVVAGEQPARTVLGDDGSTYSVKEYARRLGSTIGDHYLARDVSAVAPPWGHSYETLSEQPNKWFEEALSAPAAWGAGSKAFDDALTVARQVLKRPGIYNQAPGFDPAADAKQAAKEPDSRMAIALRDLALLVVARLCQKWFGMPDAANEAGKPPHADPLVASLERFLVTSRYTFQARPEAYLERDATARGRLIPTSYAVFGGELADYLRSPGVDYPTKVSAQAFRQAVIGAVVGFAPPTTGAIVRILDQWVETEQLWRVLALAADGGKAEHHAQVRGRVLPLLGQALGMAPSPTVLYRTVVADTRLGAVPIAAGTKVVVALAPVYTDAQRSGSPLPEAWLFGGQHGKPGPTNVHPPHGCPAREAGLDVILAIIVALAERSELRRERRFCLSYTTTSC